jgi:hypothetical protein
MRRYPVTIFIVVLSAITAAFIFLQFRNAETAKVNQVVDVTKQRSEIYARMLVHYDKPPVYEEEWRLQDVEGVSTYEYRIRGYNGKQITITAPKRRMYDVSFFFGRLDQDGVWQIVNQPPRGNTDVHYTVYVKQLADFKQGDRTITFTDPHYWATTAGRQYSIDLSKESPNDLLKLKSTELADDRYQKVVDDFRSFGPESFRTKIADARASLGLK